MRLRLTFELGDLSRRALGETLVAGVTGQRHGNATASQQEADLLTAGVLLDDRNLGQSKRQRPFCSPGNVRMIFAAEHAGLVGNRICLWRFWSWSCWSFS